MLASFPNSPKFKWFESQLSLDRTTLYIIHGCKYLQNAYLIDFIWFCVIDLISFFHTTLNNRTCKCYRNKIHRWRNSNTYFLKHIWVLLPIGLKDFIERIWIGSISHNTSRQGQYQHFRRIHPHYKDKPCDREHLNCEKHGVFELFFAC